MTKQRTWKTRNQEPGPTNEPPLRPTIHPPLEVQLATPLRLTAWPGELLTPRAPCLTTTVLTPSCIYSATWGLTNREATRAQTESWSWESRQSEWRNSGGLKRNAEGEERRGTQEQRGVGCLLLFLSPGPLQLHKEHRGPATDGGGRATHTCWEEVHILQSLNITTKQVQYRLHNLNEGRSLRWGWGGNSNPSWSYYKGMGEAWSSHTRTHTHIESADRKPEYLSNCFNQGFKYSTASTNRWAFALLCARKDVQAKRVSLLLPSFDFIWVETLPNFHYATHKNSWFTPPFKHYHFRGFRKGAGRRRATFSWATNHIWTNV